MKQQLYLLCVNGNNEKLTVIFSFIILSSFVGYIFIYKPHADQMQLEAVVVNLEADDRLRKQAITDLKEIADSGHAVAQYRYAELLLRDGNVSEALPYLEKSSEQGELISKELLGLTYLESQDVEQKLWDCNKSILRLDKVFRLATYI
ncbi:sel1 repeat family protein [Vibrio parahaemolyticus]|nr:sel1 repeat family protein [Vibrio parahaemolyticus]MBM5123567.1 sel1 repeat family protein [Vibrio parahaemolyticus]MBM5132477.1 sel1 repeat family protein [Vibrio parahaemolyticus]MBM5141837.1 sel1 repeat family protein [Vibrio parahaemolyticus]